MELVWHFGDILRKLRELRGWTLEELGDAAKDAAGTPIDKSTVSKIERFGGAGSEWDTVKRLVRALGVTVDGIDRATPEATVIDAPEIEAAVQERDARHEARRQERDTKKAARKAAREKARLAKKGGAAESGCWRIVVAVSPPEVGIIHAAQLAMDARLSQTRPQVADSANKTPAAVRVLFGLAFALPFAHHTYQAAITRGRPSDFGLVWAAARFFAHGVNPYLPSVIGPQGSFWFEFTLNYPLPAVLAGLPVAWLSAPLADAVFFGLSVFALVWGLTRERLANPQLCALFSFALFTAEANVQWSPLMTAAVLIPNLGVLLACKPTLGLALLAAFPSRRALIGAGCFGVLSIVLWPWWVPGWLTVLRTQTHMIAPVTLWWVGGPLVLLALLKWRRPEARLLVALACMPHNVGGLNEVLPLFLVVSTWPEGIALVILTAIAAVVQATMPMGDSLRAWGIARGQWSVLLVYLPCLLLVLRRPNVGLFWCRDVGVQRQPAIRIDRIATALEGIHLA